MKRLRRQYVRRRPPAGHQPSHAVPAAARGGGVGCARLESLTTHSGFVMCGLAVLHVLSAAAHLAKSAFLSFAGDSK